MCLVLFILVSVGRCCFNYMCSGILFSELLFGEIISVMVLARLFMCW